MAKIKICIEPDCKNTQTTENYCRLHYLKNWKALRENARQKAADRLNKYVDGICKKFPEKYVDVIRREIRSGKSDFQMDSANDESDLVDGINDNFGFQDDESVDKLILRIKIDKDF